VNVLGKQERTSLAQPRGVDPLSSFKVRSEPALSSPSTMAELLSSTAMWSALYPMRAHGAETSCAVGSK